MWFTPTAPSIAPPLGGKLPDLPITFYHSRDDDFVDFANMARYREKLPAATYREVDGHKHQFLGEFAELVEDVRERL